MTAPVPFTSPSSGAAVLPSIARAATAARGRLVPCAQRKRVVHISLGTGIGGMEQLLVEFARHADHEQFDLHFFCLQHRGPLAEQIEMLGWPVAALDKRDGFRPGLVIRLARQLHHLRPSVVHTHNAAAMVYGVAAARLARVPRIIHTWHGQRYAATNRQHLLFRLLSHSVDRIVCVSSDSRERAIANGVSAARMLTIHNGVDLSRFPFSGPVAAASAVLVARLSPEKDIATLIRAISVANARRCRTACPLRLSIVGDGNERQHLESLVRQLGEEPNIDFLGMRDDVPKLLAHASMFVLPSRTEGLSLAILEAMASGLPVVACAVGGNPEIVLDQQTGLLVPPGDPEAMAEAMLRLHQTPSLAAMFGERGHRRVTEWFGIRRMMQAYEALYGGEPARNRAKSNDCGEEGR